MTPFPFQWDGFFIVGVLGVAPCCGVGGLVLGVVMSSGVSTHWLIQKAQTPSWGHQPKHQEKLGKGGIKT